MKPKQPNIGDMYDRMTVKRLAPSEGRTATGGFDGQVELEIYTAWCNIRAISYGSTAVRQQYAPGAGMEVKNEYKVIARKGVVQRGDIVELNIDGNIVNTEVIHVNDINRAMVEIITRSREKANL